MGPENPVRPPTPPPECLGPLLPSPHPRPPGAFSAGTPDAVCGLSFLPWRLRTYSSSRQLSGFPASASSLSCLRETPYLNSLYVHLHLLVQPEQINVNAMQTKCITLSGSDPEEDSCRKKLFSSFGGIPIQHSWKPELRGKSSLLMQPWLGCLVLSGTTATLS